MKRHKIKRFQGVYYRDSSTKRHDGKPDRCFDITYKENGKLVWEKVGWKSEGYTSQAASQIRAERIRAIRHGEELPRKKEAEKTFGEVWDEYEKWLESNKARPKDDGFLYKNHLKPRFEKKLMSKITPLDLEKMKSDILGKGLSPATAKHCLVPVVDVIDAVSNDSDFFLCLVYVGSTK